MYISEEKFTLPEIPDSWITLLAVFIAGAFALYNLRHSIKLQAKNKWKEDFRIHVAEYIEIFLSSIFLAAEFERKKKDNKPFTEKLSVLAQTTSRMVASFSKIRLMLSEKDKDSQELIKLFELQNSHLDNIISGEREERDLESLISEFTTVAKRIYIKK